MTRTAATGILAALALVALAGCAESGALDASSSPEPSTSVEPTPTGSPSAEPAPSAPEGGEDRIDTSAWLTHGSDDGEFAFRHPADWTIETTTSEPMPYVGPDGDRRLDSAELTSPDGQMLLAVYDFIDRGGACGITSDGEPEVERLEVLATEPLAGALLDTSIATVALGSVDGRWTFGMGLIEPSVLEQDETCVVGFATGSSQGGIAVGAPDTITVAGDDPLWTVDSLDDARASMETDEYATLLEILRSFRFA